MPVSLRSGRASGGFACSRKDALLIAVSLLGAIGQGAGAVQAQETGFAPTSERDSVSAAAAEDPEDSLRCLTLAVAYEAGNQPRDGQQAVAEVVLNRLAHVAFPKTVCGVVFQGWQRGRSCQFTFVCDGALSRRLSDQTISAARSVAIGAMGSAMGAASSRLVAGALNYHANYVSPVWAGNLVPVARIGAHIFYRPPPGGKPEGALATAQETGDKDSGDALANRWARPDHAMIARVYARYDQIGQPVVTASLGRTSAPPASLRRQEPKVFAPWGLALR